MRHAAGQTGALRPIERSDVPRLWELIQDFEVVVLASSHPPVPVSLAEFEAWHEATPSEQTKEAPSPSRSPVT